MLPKVEFGMLEPKSDQSGSVKNIPDLALYWVTLACFITILNLQKNILLYDLKTCQGLKAKRLTKIQKNHQKGHENHLYCRNCSRVEGVKHPYWSTILRNLKIFFQLTKPMEKYHEVSSKCLHKLGILKVNTKNVNLDWFKKNPIIWSIL